MSQLNSTIAPQLPAKVVTAKGQIRVSAQPGNRNVGLNVFGTYAELSPHGLATLWIELEDAYKVATGTDLRPM